MGVSKVIATFLGIGYMGKGGGTVAALACCLLVYLSVTAGIYTNARLLLFSIIMMIAGVITATEVESSWGKDSKMVVIDEVLGMAVSLLFLPINLMTLGLGFVLFRFFDIVKPLYIRRLENLRGGWGVMLDDLAAGVYTNILLQIIVYFYSGEHVDIS